MTLFNVAQTFFLEPNLKGVSKLKLSGFDVFFKYKPAATSNRSGINYPGVTAYLTDTDNGVPVINEKTYQQFARAEWNDIFTSSDATIPTAFRFNVGTFDVDTGKTYAILLSFDGNESFWPWTAKIGAWINGPGRVIYSGPSGGFIGKYFEFTQTSANSAATANNFAAYAANWRPLTDTTLTFDITAARFFINGTPIFQATLPGNTFIHTTGLPQTSNGAFQVDFLYPGIPFEHVTFSLANSTINEFIGAQRVYQNTVLYPGGFANNSTSISISTVTGNTIVTANTNFPNGTPFNWNTVFNNYTGIRFVTMFDTSGTNIRMIRSILSNTQIQVTEPVTFTNSIATFLISPIATVDSLDTSSPSGKKTEFMRMSGSNANSSVRFVNNCVEAITVNVGGTGYLNSDILYITGFENVAGKVIGGYNAIANLQTNATGGITTLFLSNIGCGFVNSATMVAVVSNATSGNTTGNTSAGSGATFVYTVGATLKTELTSNIFKNCQLVNLDLADANPFFDMFVPPGTTATLGLRMQYYIQNDTTTFSGFSSFVYPGGQFFPNIQLLKRNRFRVDQQPVFLSYSNEFVVAYSNGFINDQVNALSVTSNNYLLDVNTTSNNDFLIVTLDTTPTIEFGKYVYNNDYTLEETNFGNCWARHLTTRTTFARLSEDIRVYLTAYRPANTDFQVYARIQNSGDPEPFDDEDWTRLTMVDGSVTSFYSSPSDETDYNDYAFGFQPQPNTLFTLGGIVVSSGNNKTNVVGTNTTFQANLN
ncbi:MAG TPA: hypothetical protein VEP90_00420, partial [Methylomirabilota bacterium]|nr:hypothetical protein [Methylomirabilota bacterium]